jgi:hypothetical protein
METPCPARRPCIIRYKSPVRHQSHYTIELTPGESFQQTADDDAEDTNRDIGNRVKHPKFNSNLPVSFNWSHHTRLNGSKNSPLFNCGSICMLNVLSAERQEVRPSVRPSFVCMIRFHSSGPAKRAMSAESPVTETCRDQQNRRGCFYTNGEG